MGPVLFFLLRCLVLAMSLGQGTLGGESPQGKFIVQWRAAVHGSGLSTLDVSRGVDNAISVKSSEDLVGACRDSTLGRSGGGVLGGGGVECAYRKASGWSKSAGLILCGRTRGCALWKGSVLLVGFVCIHQVNVVEAAKLTCQLTKKILVPTIEKLFTEQKRVCDYVFFSRWLVV